MAKHPLRRGIWGDRAAVIFLTFALSGGLLSTDCRAEGDAVQQAAPVPGSADVKPPQETEKKPAVADSKDPIPENGPADTKPAEPKAAGAQPADKPAEPKGADGQPAAPKDVKAEAKPKSLAPKPEISEGLVVRASVVNAIYHISFLGAYIGDFTIRSSITNRQYTLQAKADVSVFFGSISWQGVTSSQGLMTANGPVPQNYNFRYATNDRREAVELRFQQRMVQDIIINPPQHPGPRNVPITAAHLQNVVDPLSAVVLLSQARLTRGGEACNKRLPIFDGKMRYDLVLYPKGTRAIPSAGRLHGMAHVCGVKFVPIAGHKPGKQSENDYATGNSGIEVWLVPLPEAGLLVPYHVIVPTPAGTATIVTAKFDVETPAGRHALAE